MFCIVILTQNVVISRTLINVVISQTLINVVISQTLINVVISLTLINNMAEEFGSFNLSRLNFHTFKSTPLYYHTM